jgi:hypothetical protein
MLSANMITHPQIEPAGVQIKVFRVEASQDSISKQKPSSREGSVVQIRFSDCGPEKVGRDSDNKRSSFLEAFAFDGNLPSAQLTPRIVKEIRQGHYRPGERSGSRHQQSSDQLPASPGRHETLRK